MNNDSVAYTCTALPPGKRGQLKKDESGYYEVIVGALDAYSNVGDFYPEQGSREVFDESSMFQRRIQQGTLYGEWGHPYPLPGEKFQDFARRCAYVSENKVSHHFKKIWLDYNGRDQEGKPAILIMALVKPEGPYAESLRSNLENPFANSCFSIRAFTEDKTIRGVLHRKLTEVITFDFVLESGMGVARKFAAPTLECLQAIPMTKRDLINAYESMEGIPAMESGKVVLHNLLTKKGWGFSNLGSNRPISLLW